MEDAKTIELLCQLTRAANLQQLCDLACEITGNPAFISDLAHTILAYTKCVEVPDPTWQGHIIQADLDRNTLRQDREVGAVHSSSTDSSRPVLVDDGYLPYPRIIRTLISDGQPVGVIVVTSYLRPFGPNDIGLVELIASFAAPCLVRERYHISGDSRAVENFFIQLLDGARLTREQVEKRLNVLNGGLRPCTYVLTVCTRDGTSDHERTDLRELLQAFAAIPFTHAFLYNSLLVCVYGEAVPILDWARQAPRLMELLQRWDLIAGVSRQVTAVERLKDYYHQAQAILDIGRQLGRPDLCFPYDSLSSFLLFDRIPPDELELYCHQQIRELWAYDQAHGAGLCATLQVYLEQAKSLARTADLLFIHRNTVHYRINRCIELLGSRLEDGNEIFAYILSLRILEYKDKLLRSPCRPCPMPGDQALL